MTLLSDRTSKLMAVIEANCEQIDKLIEERDYWKDKVEQSCLEIHKIPSKEDLEKERMMERDYHRRMKELEKKRDKVIKDDIERAFERKTAIENTAVEDRNSRLNKG